MNIKKTVKSFVTHLFCIPFFSFKYKEEIENDIGAESEAVDEVSKEDRNRFFEEIRIQWQSTVEDTRIAKNQQWMTIYYGFLLQFAFIYMISEDPNRETYKWFLIIPVIICAYIVCIFQKKMQEYRQLIVDIQKNFTSSFRNIVKPLYDKRKGYLCFWYGSVIPVAMTLLLVLVTLLAIIKY